MLSPALHSLMIEARADDLYRAARVDRLTRRHQRYRARRPRARPTAIGLEPAVTIRYAFPDDSPALGRLAALDSREPPRAPALLAEVDGELWAALSLTDAGLVADPFRPTTALVELLAARAQQLHAAAGGGWGVRRPWRQQPLRRRRATAG